MKSTIIVAILLIILAQSDKLRVLQSTLQTCQDHLDCPVNTICDYTKFSCTPRTCGHDNDCIGNSTCWNGHCLVDGYNTNINGSTNGPCSGNVDCANGYLCNFNSLNCEIQPINCNGDNECGQGYYCDFVSNATCQPLPSGACYNNRDCPKPQVCFKPAHARWGSCRINCQSHNDCYPNKICNFDYFFHLCLPKQCVSDNDCIGADWTCPNGYCYQ